MDLNIKILTDVSGKNIVQQWFNADDLNAGSAIDRQRRNVLKPFQVTMLRTADEGVRNALIQLGWTPPTEESIRAAEDGSRSMSAYERLQMAHTTQLFRELLGAMEVGDINQDCEEPTWKDLHGRVSAWLAAQGHQRMPVKVEIPPPGADPLACVHAEGWNQCCDEFFGGLPPQPPLVVEITKEVISPGMVAAINAFIEEATFEDSKGKRQWRLSYSDAERHVKELQIALRLI